MPAPLVRWIAGIEQSDRYDTVASKVRAASGAVTAGRVGAALRGDWLGHAFHPLLTDFPLGCWLSAGLLDLGGLGRRHHRASAQALIGCGLVAAVPTAAAGMADYGQIADPRSKRVGALHAMGNGLVSSAYLASWLLRRRGHHAAGVACSMTGGAGAWVTGYLGGHLSLARHEGSGERGMRLPAAPSHRPSGVPPNTPA